MRPVPIFTQCDETFLPGLIALHNSYLRNSQEGFSFHAILSGRQEFVEHVRRLGIDVIHDPEFPTDRYPISRHYPVAHPIMYKNMLAADHLFADCERSIYIDTDSIILRSLLPLAEVDIGEKVLAATRCNSTRATNYSPSGAEGEGFGPMTSLMVFNHAPFRAKRVLGRFVEAMQRDDMQWPMIGQGVLHYVVQDDWLELPWHTQAHAGHQTYWTAPREEIYLLHFMGTKPWREFAEGVQVTERKLEARAIWRQYADEEQGYIH